MPSVFDITQRKGLEQVTKEAKAEFTSVYKEFYSGGEYGTMKGDGAYEEFVRFTGLPGIAKENSKYDATPQLQAFEPKMYRIRFEEYRGGFFYLTRDLDDDQIGFFKKQAASLGKSMAYTHELLGHYIFNNATNGALLGGWDNKTLGASNHDLLNGQTYSNLLPAGGPSEATMQSILDYYDRVPNDNGRPYKVNSIRLFVHTKRYRDWRRLVGSSVAFTSPVDGSANANSAITTKFGDDNVTVIGTPYLENESTVICIGAQHELFWIDRTPTRSRMIQKEDPEGYLHTISWRGNVGWVDPKMVAIVQPS